MHQIIISSFVYTLISIVFLSSVLGFGRFVNNYFFKLYSFSEFKNFDFIIGLIFVGTLSIIFNFFSSLNNYYTLLIILIGIFFYLYFLFIKKNFKKELFFILIVIFISYCFSFYAGVNDDYTYHFKTIINFKEKNLFFIEHHRMVSYNSHWLLLNSVYYFTFISSTLFILTSLLFAITIYDFSINYKKNLKNNNYLLAFYLFFFLVFLLGVLNTFKDYGTDFTGAIVCIYIFIIFIELVENKKNKFENKEFFLLLLLSNFAFMIKITNSLIYIPILIIFLNLKKNIQLLLVISLSSIPVFLWLYQNINISSCLIWPISVLCYENIDLAKREFYLIESFAKGDINTSINVGGLSWVIIWFKSQFVRIAETYFVYSIIIILPIMYFKFTYQINFLFLLKKFLFENNLKRFYYLVLPIIFFNLIWFFLTPAYRFGVFYNLTAILFLVAPFWIQMYFLNKNLTNKFLKCIIFIAVVFFAYENFTRIEWYLLRYENIWPPIINGKLIKI